MMILQCLTLHLFLFPSTLSVTTALDIPFPGGAGISYQNGVLRIKMGGPMASKITSLEIPPPDTKSSACIDVRDTGTMKGYGAFAEEPIEEGSFLGFYEGTLIRSREKLDQIIRERQKGPTEKNAMDYVMSLDGGVTFLDGFERATDRTSFSPVHFNHADRNTKECNCVRIMQQQKQQLETDNGVPYCVAFFTIRVVQANEELCFDYGKNFWNGREDQKI
jgi:hypothetical protein